MTSVFEDVNTGPAIYARYLMEAFRDDPEINFKLVAPFTSSLDNKVYSPRHSKQNSSRQLYKALQRQTLEIASNYTQPPIIHTNNAHAIWLLRNYRGPVISQINDYDVADAFKGFHKKIMKYGWRRCSSLIWRRFNEKHSIGFCDKVICNSTFTQSRLKQAYPKLNLGHSTVIHKAVDVKFFIEPQSDNAPDKFKLIGTNRILFLGANWRRKGLDLAIRALKKIIPSNPNCSLIVAGKQGQKADADISDLPKKLGIEANVQFLGSVKREDLPCLFSACNLMTLPSREEALGVAILEALAAGLPVVGTNVGGIPEILGDCQHSKLVEPDDPSVLAEAFKEVLSSNADQSVIKMESQTIANRFSKKIMIEKIKNLYLEIEASRVD